MKLKNKIVLITGASRGIGQAIAETFSNEGATVIVNYLNSEDKAMEIIKKIRVKSLDSIAIKADVSNQKEVRNMFAQIQKEFGGLDVLVNNAGVLYRGKPEDLDESTWDHIFDVNVKGTFMCSMEAAKIMKNRDNPTIINISSVAALIAVPSEIPYGASKAAIDSLTKSLAEHFAPYIRVNGIAPGLVETDMNTGPTAEKFKDPEFMSKMPVRRWAKPYEMADIALFLVDTARFVNGETIVADGGFRITIRK